jgi:cation diffusion facilitator CzcD-associated flavoprotein CzcO
MSRIGERAERVERGGNEDRGEQEPRFVVIGGGMAGILSAVKLAEAGFTDVTVYEKADRLGGTWRENTYPGVACDVPSHLYSYSFAPNSEWSTTFAGGSEILAYFEAVARRFDVDKHVIFGAEVTRLEFVDNRWEISLADGRRDWADYVIAATGVLHHPFIPDIPGLDDFAGARFHSARWDHAVELAGARVGIIGTGSTSVQITSSIVDTVDRLTVFQRTPQWVLPVPNTPIDPGQRERYRSDAAAMATVRGELSKMFEDNFANAVVDAESPQVKAIQEVCRAYLESAVTDPELREKLRPDYPAGCKRLIISPDFYEKIQRPNARVVTEAIRTVEEHGVRTVDDELHELDVLVLATGFRVDRFMRPIEIVGRRGTRLDDVWAERPTAYLAVSVPDFPNLFMLNGPNGPVGNFSLIEVAELQLGYVMQLIDAVRARGARAVSASAAATEAFESRRVAAAAHTVWVTGCRSWYLDDRGIPAVWPWTFNRFREDMSHPDVADFEIVG